jgi:DoxX-like protein
VQEQERLAAALAAVEEAQPAPFEEAARGAPGGSADEFHDFEDGPPPRGCRTAWLTEVGSYLTAGAGRSISGDMDHTATADAGTQAQPRWMTITGWVLSILPVLVLAVSAFFKFQAKPEVVQAFTGKYGYQPAALSEFGIVEIACTLLYLFPRTAVLGAVLLTGYLGGATATHFRAGEPFYAPVLVGVFLWGGLFFRDARVRDLLPLRR